MRSSRVGIFRTGSQGRRVGLKVWIARALWSAAASLAIGIVSMLLSVVLAGLGDQKGAEAVVGVCLVSAAVFTVSLITLVAILAVRELQRDDPPSAEGR